MQLWLTWYGVKNICGMSVYSKGFTFPILCSSRSVEIWASKAPDNVAGSTVTKTTVRSTSASVNGTLDPNCNSQISVEGEFSESNLGCGFFYLPLCGRALMLLQVTLAQEFLNVWVINRVIACRDSISSLYIKYCLFHLHVILLHCYRWYRLITLTFWALPQL